MPPLVIQIFSPLSVQLPSSLRVALVRIDKLLYQVKVGDYLGQNYGRVTKITEGDVDLREVVQDAAGEWIERSSELQLQEKKR